MADKKTVVILKESVPQSWLNDCFTFGMLAAMFYFNKAYLDAAIPHWVLATLFIIGLLAKAANVKRVFYNAEDAKAEIDQFFASEERDGGHGK